MLAGTGCEHDRFIKKQVASDYTFFDIHTSSVRMPSPQPAGCRRTRVQCRPTRHGRLRRAKKRTLRAVPVKGRVHCHGSRLASAHRRQTPTLRNMSNPLTSTAVRTCITNMQTMQELYTVGYEPPAWAVEWMTKQLVHMRPVLSQVVCYYPKAALGETTEKEVKTLLTEREPVNIECTQEFDKDALLARFGWQDGYYATYYETHKRLLPNIAVYCQTPVRFNGFNVSNIHMLHAIGYALDNEAQPDYQALCANNVHTSEKRQILRDRLVERYTNLFRYAFQCARRKGLDTVAMGLVGAGFFSKHYPNGQSAFRTNVWQPALSNALRVEHWSESGHQLFVLGPDPIVLDAPHFQVDTLGFFPHCLKKTKNRTSTLFVNAWDPLSMVGNGNKKDNSLDGFVGRSTASSYLCWPKSNPCISYHPVDFSELG